MRRRVCAVLLVALAILPFSAPFSTCALQDLAAAPQSDGSAATETPTIALHQARRATIVADDAVRDRSTAAIGAPMRVHAAVVTRVWRSGAARPVASAPTSGCATPLRI